MRKKNKKPGRPPLYGERMTVRREVGLRPKEATRLDSLARKAGKTFNAWAREILLAAAEERQAATAERGV
jgi:hypothetical protein